MSDEFNTAFLLLAVGMITVFTILALIVVLGNWLIRIINRFFSEKAVAIIKPVGIHTTEIQSNKLAAIVAAVDITTKGRGKVSSVKKLE